MEKKIPTEIDNLNLAIRNYILDRLHAHSKPLPYWSSLFKLIRSNRVESCFDDFGKRSENKNLGLCLKMLGQRIKILSLRERGILENQNKINEVFLTNKLFPIYFKGFALSLDNSIFHRIRFFEDIDLIIDPCHASHYLEVLFSLGYRTKFHSTNIDPLIVLNCTGSLNLSSQKLGHNIDLHTSAIWPYFPQVLKYEDLIDDAREIKLKDTSYLIPSLPHHSLILLLEGTKDMWFRIDKLLDFYFCFLNLKNIEREEFNNLIAKNKLNRMLDLANYLLTNIFKFNGANLPIHQTYINSLKCITNQISTGWECEFKKYAPAEPFRTKAHFAIMESSWSKLRYMIKRAGLPTENDLKAFSLPSWTCFMFLILRPARKLFNMGRKVTNSNRWRLLWH